MMHGQINIKYIFMYSADEGRTYLYLHHPLVFLRLLFPIIRWPAEWNLNITWHLSHTNTAELGYKDMRGTEYFVSLQMSVITTEE
jgi:hypothetical protein